MQVIRENGNTLPTYAHRDRFYVQGNAGERYIIKVTNPTARRVEAVVTVDGLDVIDGEDGDLRKRGYVVPPYGEVRIEGFRTSQSDVATFRFNSVNDSYANKKGKARNVGVIAVAIFEEQHNEQQIIVEGGGGGGTGYGGRGRYNYEDDLAERAPAPTNTKDSYRAPPPRVSRAPDDAKMKKPAKADESRGGETVTSRRPSYDKAPRPVPQGGQVRHQPHEPEQHGDGHVGRDREHVPHQGAAELRPEAHRVRQGEHPVRVLVSSDVEQRIDPGLDHGEDRHRLRKAVDGGPPSLV